MRKLQTNLIKAQESLSSFLKETTDKSDEEIKNLSIKFLDQIQKKLTNKDDKTLILESLKEAKHNQPIYINGISYISLCEHHMMPFHGSASIAVFPKKKILGISKFGDLVGHFSKLHKILFSISFNF